MIKMINKPTVDIFAGSASSVLAKVPVILPDGTQANLNTNPVNHAEVITYPETADEVLNEEAFRKWQFIRLPEKFGGERKDVSSFRAYSMVCLHLWCLWKYWPDEGRMRGECPCHGSMYDVKTGTAYLGPASLQPAPSTHLLILTLRLILMDLCSFLLQRGVLTLMEL